MYICVSGDVAVVFMLYIVSGMELQMAKSEFVQKEKELTKAFAKVESLLDELSNLQKQKVSSTSSDQQQEKELDKLQLELEVSKWNDPILKLTRVLLSLNPYFRFKYNVILFVSSSDILGNFHIV